MLPEAAATLCPLAQRQIDGQHSCEVGITAIGVLGFQGGNVRHFLDVPGSHFNGYKQTVDRKEVGAPKGYSAYWGGADIGVTNHPSEFLVCGQRQDTDELELLLRIQPQRINTDDQKSVVEWIFERYGDKLEAFALDRTESASRSGTSRAGTSPARAVLPQRAFQTGIASLCALNGRSWRVLSVRSAHDSASRLLAGVLPQRALRAHWARQFG